MNPKKNPEARRQWFRRSQRVRMSAATLSRRVPWWYKATRAPVYVPNPIDPQAPMLFEPARIVAHRWARCGRKGQPRPWEVTA